MSVILGNGNYVDGNVVYAASGEKLAELSHSYYFEVCVLDESRFAVMRNDKVFVYLNNGENLRTLSGYHALDVNGVKMVTPDYIITWGYDVLCLWCADGYSFAGITFSGEDNDAARDAKAQHLIKLYEEGGKGRAVCWPPLEHSEYHVWSPKHSTYVLWNADGAFLTRIVDY